MTDQPRVERQLIRDASRFERIAILGAKMVPTAGNTDWAVAIVLQVDEDIIESCAFGLVYLLGLLSFQDGPPRDSSGPPLEDDDEFTAADMLRHLAFERGKITLRVDCIRGRSVRTDVEVSSDGRVILTTVNRGYAAMRWVDRLKGKDFSLPGGTSGGLAEAAR